MNMIKILLSFALIFILTIGVSAQILEQVDAVQFKELVKPGEGVILDVRTPQEYSRGHIEGSTLINISDREFISKINLLQKDKPVYLYCLTGSRSSAAARYMAKMGFKELYNLQRGIMDWNRKGFPVVQSKVAVASASVTYSEKSFRQLIDSKKVVLIDFHAPWCVPCKKMSPVIEKLAKDYEGKATVEKVDVEANKAISESYQVQSIPGFVLFKDGQKVWSHKGMISYDELSKTIQQYL
jgi:thioredoxin 1